MYIYGLMTGAGFTQVQQLESVFFLSSIKKYCVEVTSSYDLCLLTRSAYPVALSGYRLSLYY